MDLAIVEIDTDRIGFPVLWIYSYGLILNELFYGVKKQVFDTVLPMVEGG